MDEEIGGTTSVYVGRWNRNPCKFMNRETLSQHTFYHSVNAKSRYYTSSKIISKYNPNKTLVGTNGDKEDGTNIVKVFKKSFPSICKYWTDKKCVYSEQCLNLHLWFHGDGFFTLTQLSQHKKILTLKLIFSIIKYILYFKFRIVI